jgi:hypothetical protein
MLWWGGACKSHACFQGPAKKVMNTADQTCKWRCIPASGRHTILYAGRHAVVARRLQKHEGVCLGSARDSTCRIAALPAILHSAKHPATLHRSCMHASDICMQAGVVRPAALQLRKNNNTSRNSRLVQNHCTDRATFTLEHTRKQQL